MVAGRLLSNWEAKFSGAMLNFQGVMEIQNNPNYKTISELQNKRGFLHCQPKQYTIQCATGLKIYRVVPFFDSPHIEGNTSISECKQLHIVVSPFSVFLRDAPF